MWIAICEKGLSKPYFVPSGLAINQYTYLDECIKKRLIPFIKEYHSDGQYVFWPDLATAHYATIVVEYLNEESVHFVQKQENPANLPECRPIENFWGILKGLVYEHNWQAKSLDQLRSRITRCLKKIDIDLVKRVMASVRCKIGQVKRDGVIEKN